MKIITHNNSNSDLLNIDNCTSSNIDESNITISFENEDKVIEALTNFYNTHSNSQFIDILNTDNTIEKAYESLDDIFKILDDNFINI